MLDFTADWCVSCKEMEDLTFPDAGVIAALQPYLLLRADVTDNDDNDQALLQHVRSFGPPTIAFFDRAGTERENFKLVGFVPAGEFLHFRNPMTAAVTGIDPFETERAWTRGAFRDLGHSPQARTGGGDEFPGGIYTFCFCSKFAEILKDVLDAMRCKPDKVRPRWQCFERPRYFNAGRRTDLT